MNVLGIHIGHDSSVALVQNGKLVADVAEERFSRIKHFSGLPFKSLDYCLKAFNLTMDDIDLFADKNPGWNGSISVSSFSI